MSFKILALIIMVSFQAKQTLHYIKDQKITLHCFRAMLATVLEQNWCKNTACNTQMVRKNGLKFKLTSNYSPQISLKISKEPSAHIFRNKVSFKHKEKLKSFILNSLALLRGY